MLTFAGLDAPKPLVISFSTVPIPSTPGSAATIPARFLERAALWTRHYVAVGDV